MNLILLTQLFACAFLTGLIWMIQLVHYPSFHYINEDNFAKFAKFHASRISVIVIPAMMVDLISAFLLLNGEKILLANFIMTLLIWLSTAVFSVPCHKRLQENKDPKIIVRLVKSNWPRTIMWSIRSGLLAWYVLKL